MAKDWTRRPRVLVIGLRASRTSQAVGAHDPRLEAFGEQLEQVLGLLLGDVQVDVLLACGLGHEVRLDDAGACSERFVANTKQHQMPEVVLLVGTHAAAAARGAGLITTNGVNEVWWPLGTPAPCRLLLCDQASISTWLATQLSTALGVTAQNQGVPRDSKVLAPLLLQSLGQSRGSATKGVVDGHWVRKKRRRLSVDMVEGHLRHRRFVAPFRPVGSWPFVVIDIDRHDALQDAHFDETVAAVRQHFPQSLWVVSSQSGGYHVYVKLPGNMTYEDAAVWLEYFFAWKGLLAIEREFTRPQGNKTRLRSSRLEVPAHPVRLPFGEGSHVAGSSQSRKAQLNVFLSFVQSAPSHEFEQAQLRVAGAKKKTLMSGHTKRARLRKEVEQLMLLGLEPRALPATDPWAGVIGLLDTALRVVASRGVPAMGTRTYWTQRLLKALFDLVPPSQVEDLLAFWLYDREHNSEDIEIDVGAVEADIQRAIEEQKAALAGVPVRVWRHVEPLVMTELQRRQQHTPLRPRAASFYARPGVINEVRRAAFFTLRFFFSERAANVTLSARRFFGRFVPKDDVAELVNLLSAGNWLINTRAYSAGVKSTPFHLGDALWPLLPGEPVLFVP